MCQPSTFHHNLLHALLSGPGAYNQLPVRQLEALDQEVAQ